MQDALERQFTFVKKFSRKAQIGAVQVGNSVGKCTISTLSKLR